MSERKRIFYLLLIMTIVSFSLVGITISFLYKTALNEEKERLTETAKSQARLIESVARFNKKFNINLPEGSRGATLSQIEDAYAYYQGFGKTGEFTLANLDHGNINFLLSHRHGELEHPRPVAFDSDIAEPMRRALSGKSGTVVGPDYRGVTVMAAYEPVGELNLGIVAKIDLAEIQAPFKEAISIVIALSIIIILGGASLFLRISNPIIRQLVSQAEDLSSMNQKLKQEIIYRKQTEKELKDSENKFRELSIIDNLTKLYNSRHFYNQLKTEIDRVNRYNEPVTLILLDVDNFKAFNDTYGHIEGDQVLVQLGQVIKSCLRETDSAYRYGGEEFIVLLPMTECKDGIVTAERIREEFKKENFSPMPAKNVHMSLSIGVCQYKQLEKIKDFIHRVDQIIYLAKKNGKDKVCYES